MNILIIYNNVDLALKTCALLARAGRCAGEEPCVKLKPWRLDLIQHPLTADAIGRDALEAHLLVLAICPRADAPGWLLEWLENWAAKRQVPEAAVAVYDGTDGDLSASRAAKALSDFAARNHLGFIRRYSEVNEPASLQTLEDLQRRETAQTAVLRSIMSRPISGYFRDWGINE